MEARRLTLPPPPVSSPAAMPQLGPTLVRVLPAGRYRLAAAEARAARFQSVSPPLLALAKTARAPLPDVGPPLLPLAETSRLAEPDLPAVPAQSRVVDSPMEPLTALRLLPQPISPVPAGAHYLAVIPGSPVVVAPPATLRLDRDPHPQQKRHAYRESTQKLPECTDFHTEPPPGFSRFRGRTAHFRLADGRRSPRANGSNCHSPAARSPA